MDVLLIDYGSNNYKVGTSLDNFYRIYGLPNNILDMSLKCRANKNLIEIMDSGETRLKELLKFQQKSLPSTFFVSQHMDYEMKRENFIKKTFELYFENYNFEKGQTWLQPFLSFYAAKDPTNNNMFLIDSGEHSTYFIPFYDNYIIRDSIERSPLCGSMVTQHLKSYLERNGCYEISNFSDLQIKNLKEHNLQICPDYNLFFNQIIKKENFYWREIEMPDKTKLILKKEVYEIPEVLFNPSAYGFTGNGLPQKMFESIKVNLREHTL